MFRLEFAFRLADSVAPRRSGNRFSPTPSCRYAMASAPHSAESRMGLRSIGGGQMARKRTRDQTHTPIGREFARLASLSTDDPQLDAFRGHRTFRADELTVWTASVGASKLLLGPTSARPNPCVAG